MRLFFLIIIVLGCNFLTAQNNLNLFSKLYADSTGGAFLMPFVDTLGDNYITITSENGPNVNRLISYQLVDSLGNLSESYKLDSMDYYLLVLAHGFTKTKDGEYVIAYGKLLEDNTGDIRVVRFTKEGEIKWKKDISNPAHEFLRNIIPTSDGGCLLLGGWQVLEPFEFSNNYLVKMDSLGEVEWSKQYLLGDTAQAGPGNDGFGNIAFSAIQMSDGYVIGSAAKINGLDRDIAWFKIDLDGELIWTKSIENELVDDCWATFYPWTDSTYLMLSCLNQPYQRGLLVAEMNAEFDTLWSVYHDTPERNYFPIGDPVIHSNGDFTSLTNFTYYPGALEQPQLIRVDRQGEIKWKKNYTLTITNGVILESLKPTKDGGFIMAGYQSTGQQQGWLIKTDSVGNTCSYIGCDSSVLLVDTTTSLSSLSFDENHIIVSPNPANDYVLVKHEIYNREHLSFQLYDLNGRLVKKQVVLEPSLFHRVWLKDLVEGIYVYTLTDERNQIYKNGQLVIQH